MTDFKAPTPEECNIIITARKLEREFNQLKPIFEQQIAAGMLDSDSILEYRMRCLQMAELKEKVKNICRYYNIRNTLPGVIVAFIYYHGEQGFTEEERSKLTEMYDAHEYYYLYDIFAYLRPEYLLPRIGSNIYKKTRHHIDMTHYMSTKKHLPKRKGKYVFDKKACKLALYSADMDARRPKTYNFFNLI